MALRKVPGSRNYRADDRGLRELGISQGMSAAVMETARKMAGNAEAVGDSTYEAVRVVVRAGRDNEPRAGASVREVDKHWRDSRDAILIRVADAMKIRVR